jgi:hypothetical protein
MNRTHDPRFQFAPVAPEVPGLARLFAQDAYRFQFGMRRGGNEWFDLSRSSPDALAERRRWVDESFGETVVWSPEAAPLLEELRRLFAGVPDSVESEPASAEACGRFSSLWEPDFVLLRPDGAGDFRLAAGCVCFPSSWSVREKLGLPVTAIHDIVPTLNETLGERIRRFLLNVQGDAVWERENWGLAAHGERNNHPWRELPRPGPDTPLGDYRLRVEHQAFRALPQSGGLLFVIHLMVHPLTDVLRDAALARDFRRMIETMPEEIARYKGIDAGRESLLRQLAVGD